MSWNWKIKRTGMFLEGEYKDWIAKTEFLDNGYYLYFIGPEEKDGYDHWYESAEDLEFNLEDYKIKWDDET